MTPTENVHCSAMVYSVS